ncbi:unnamed protein product [Anisakis simplex]|uniref:Yemanuclein-alpha (inferred by orthology to a D. melanogaster protein) n=1 Tax=Anisakis simplex TaxID=6269 RepID=A0A0M3K102_ANISI|nr:unnamed protein product [Anisakis simplex]
MNLNLAGSKKKHRKNKKYSIVTLDLFRPTKKSYPEFDYEQICKEYLKEDESSGEDERFHDKEAEMLCKRLEEKYGGQKDKRGRRIRLGTPDDFMDKSAGYDLNDPFIDDSEAYDEHVPSTMDTMKGGFYVNKGKLEFRPKYAQDSDSDSEQLTVKKKPAEKRRRVASDDEETNAKSSQAASSNPTATVPKASTSKPIAEMLSSTPSSSLPSRKTNESGCESVPNEPTSESVRLSASGAPPSSSNKDSASRRLLSQQQQQQIKKRRLIGQPPSARINNSLSATPPSSKPTPSSTKKLKTQQSKKGAVGDSSAEELDGFLKDMTGGEDISLENLDEGMNKLAKELLHETPEGSRSPSIASNRESDAPTIDLSKEDRDSQQHSRAQSEPSAASSEQTSSAIKRPPLGRPPGSTNLTPASKPFQASKPSKPKMSKKLSLLVETFKQKTKEYGAPEKKIRLPPSLVDLCVRIEEQCSIDGLNHHNKTRVFDVISKWVCVQRSSLYFRMKAYKDRKLSLQKAVETGNESTTGTADVSPPQAGTTSSSSSSSSSSDGAGQDDLEAHLRTASTNEQLSTPDTHYKSKDVVGTPCKDLTAEGQSTTALSQLNATTSVKQSGIHTSGAINNSNKLSETNSSFSRLNAKTTNESSKLNPNNMDAFPTTPTSASNSNNLTKMRTPQTSLSNNVQSISSPSQNVLSTSKGRDALNSTTKQVSTLKFDPKSVTPLLSNNSQNQSNNATAVKPSQAPQLLSTEQDMLNKTMSQLSSTNPQLFQLLSAMLQQRALSSDPSKQPHQNLATLQMNVAAILAANQQSDLLAQYQLAISNLATTPQQQSHSKHHQQHTQKSSQSKSQKKTPLPSSSSVITSPSPAKSLNSKPKKCSTSSASLVPHPTTPLSSVPSASRITPPPPTTMAERMASLLAVSNTSKLEKVIAKNNGSNTTSTADSNTTAATAQKSVSTKPSTTISTSSVQSSSSDHQSKLTTPAEKPKSTIPTTTVLASNSNEKVAQALLMIKKAVDALHAAIAVAISYSDNEYEIERKRAERASSGGVPQKRFRWIERVRSALKQLISVLFFNLEAQCPSKDEVYSTVAQYLFFNVLPSFKNRVTFENIINESVRLAPERAQLKSCPRTIALLRMKPPTDTKKKSEPSTPSSSSRTTNSSLCPDSKKSGHSEKSPKTAPEPNASTATLSASKTTEIKSVPPSDVSTTIDLTNANNHHPSTANDSAKTSTTTTTITKTPKISASERSKSSLSSASHRDSSPVSVRPKDDNSSKLLKTKNVVNNPSEKSDASKPDQIPSATVPSNQQKPRTKHTDQHEVTVRSNSSSSSSSPAQRPSQSTFSPKLTPGQKLIIAREAEERERILAEKAAREKAEREREERERERQKKIQEEKEREEAENRKRDEEAIRKWEMEEAERLEAAAEEEEAEREAQAEAEKKRLQFEEVERQGLLEGELAAELLAKEQMETEQLVDEEKGEMPLQNEEGMDERIEREKEQREREERELELKRLQEAERKRQEEIDELLGSLSPLDFDDTETVPDQLAQQQQQQEPQQISLNFGSVEQPMSHESLQNPSTPSSCGYVGIIENSPSSSRSDPQRLYGAGYGATQHGSPMFQQISTPTTASPHSIPHSPLQQQQPRSSPMQTIPSSPSYYNRIQLVLRFFF